MANRAVLKSWLCKFEIADRGSRVNQQAEWASFMRRLRRLDNGVWLGRAHVGARGEPDSDFIPRFAESGGSAVFLNTSKCAVKKSERLEKKSGKFTAPTEPRSANGDPAG